ncbi:MAG: right-handed parallel beta-helix repeat-containing protein [Pirellulales bacterium]|nr:right-handed parallel beta-helix repeat-containing protein [Pirellulales bacterium]
MRAMSFVLAVWIVSAGSAVGREIHVSNTAGDDHYNGRQQQALPDGSGPVQTIGRALQLAQAGDRIVLAKTDQPYRESISLVGNRHGGYYQQPLTIQGNGAILDGSAPVPPESWQHCRDAVFRFRPPHMSHQQLFLDDVPVTRVVAESLAHSPPKLDPLQWSLHGGHIYFCVEPNKLPQDYRLSYAHLPTGVTLLHVRGVAILDLTVQGFQLDGINLCNSARDVYLAGVVVRGNGRSGVTVGGASRAEIDGSIIGNNGRAQVLTLPYSETVLRNCDVYANTAPAWVDRGGRFWIAQRELEGGLDEDVKAETESRNAP